MRFPNISNPFHSTPQRLKDTTLEGMPLHVKQRELKTEVEAALADMTRTNPRGIKANSKGDIKLINNLSESKKSDPVAYNAACIRHTVAEHKLNMFNKENKAGLKAEAKAGPQSGANTPIPAEASGSMVRGSSPASWQSGDDAAYLGRDLSATPAPAAASGSMAHVQLDARAAAGNDVPFQSPLDQHGMPTQYQTESGQLIPGFLFPGHAMPAQPRDMSDLTFQQPRPQAQENLPTHFTTESGQTIPAYIFPGFPTPPSHTHDIAELTFQTAPQDMASHGSQIAPANNAADHLAAARAALGHGVPVPPAHQNPAAPQNQGRSYYEDRDILGQYGI